MQRVLILFAHPALQTSRVHRRMIERLPDLGGVTLNDLYEEYPAFDIDVRREQQLLDEHEVVVFQHPLYWYSTPPLLKQWEDLVLEHGWAYGSKGIALRGKKALSIVSAGGRESAYRREGHNRFTIRELLAPIEQTFRLCGVDYVPPYVIFGTHRMNDSDIEIVVERYRDVIAWLHDGGPDSAELDGHDTLNALVESGRLGRVGA